jgi:hypothetical protein
MVANGIRIAKSLVLPARAFLERFQVGCRAAKLAVEAQIGDPLIC